MEKRTENAISEYNRKIEALQAKRDALIKKEKERKAKAQEKWKGIFGKELMIYVQKVFGEDYEEQLLPEAIANAIGESLPAYKDMKNIMTDRDP